MIPGYRPRSWRARLGRGRRANQGDRPERDEQKVGQGQRQRCPLRKTVGNQRADAEYADVY